MLLAFVLGLFISLSALAPAQAANAIDFDQASKILSYDELQRMTDADRRGYIANLRLVLMEFEAAVAKEHPGSPLAKRATAQILFLKMFLAEANAASPSTSTRTAAAYSRWIASVGDAGNCRSDVKATLTVRSLRAKNVRLSCPTPVMNSCPYGYKKFAAIHGQLTCVENGVNIQIKNNQMFLSGPGYRAHKVAIRAKAKLKPHPAKILAKRTEAKSKKPTTSLPPPETTPETPPDTTPEPAADTNAEASFEANAETDPVTTATFAAPETSEASAVDGVDVSDSDPSHNVDTAVTNDDVIMNTAGDIQSASETKDDAAKVVCDEPPAMEPGACEAASKAAATKFYQDKTPHCFYAGNVLHFKDAVKKPGACQIPNEYCLNSLTCNDAKGEPIAGASARLKCANPNQVVCNPFVFNVTTDSSGRAQAICVDRGPAATAACDEKSNRLVGDKGPFLLNVKDMNGIREGWNEFATGMNSMCFDAPAKDYFCVECGVLKSRLLRMNLLRQRVAKGKEDKCLHVRNINYIKGQSNTQPSTTAPASSVK